MATEVIIVEQNNVSLTVETSPVEIDISIDPIQIEIETGGLTVNRTEQSLYPLFLGLYKIEIGAIIAPPATGYIIYNNATQVNATSLFINRTTDGGIDLSLDLSHFLALLETGVKLIIQDRNNSANFQVWEVSGTPSLSTPTWTIPVTLSASGGTGTTDFPSDEEVFISVFGGGGSSSGSGIETATAAGTDTYTATITGVAAYATHDVYEIIFTNANTGSSTININALGAKTLKKSVSTNLAATDIAAGQSFFIVYDGTNFQVIGLGGGGGAWGTITGTVTDQTDLVTYINSRLEGLMDYRGTFDASVNAYPSSGGSGTAGAILKADFWLVSVAGTLPTGLVVAAGDLVIAKVDTPGNTQANWSLVEYNVGYTPANDSLVVHLAGNETITGIKSLSAAINEAKGADIASAGTTDIGAATGNYINVTGTTTITALGTIQAGTRRVVTFSGILTLTHHATALILPTSADIITEAGDTAEFISLGSGNWKCTNYIRQSGQTLSPNDLDMIEMAYINSTYNLTR